MREFFYFRAFFLIYNSSVILYVLILVMHHQKVNKRGEWRKEFFSLHLLNEIKLARGLSVGIKLETRKELKEKERKRTSLLCSLYALSSTILCLPAVVLYSNTSTPDIHILIYICFYYAF